MKKNNKVSVATVWLMLTVVFIPLGIVAQSKSELVADDQANLLAGAWEYVGPGEVDCITRAPSGPIIRASYQFNQGGTMHTEDTFPLSGPYRSTGAGTWKRLAGREYSYGNIHYEFEPDRTFLFRIRMRSVLTLSRDG
ncbi:MAG: hypothetical protein ABJB34_08590, partial [Acidobacteriota bacterium]